MYDRILVPIDGSAPSQRGLREAVTLAKALGSQLLLLHVIDDFPKRLEAVSSAGEYERALVRMRERGQELLRTAQSSVAAAGVPVQTVLREIDMETIADAILEQVTAGDCQLVVMGTHGRRGMRRLAMGSDAELVLRASPVPVLLVRRDDEPA